MRSTRLGTLVAISTLAMATVASDAFAQPYSGGSSTGQITLSAPYEVLQGQGAINFPLSSYSVPGDMAVVTTAASYAGAVYPDHGDLSTLINVHFSGTPSGNGFGLQDQSICYLNAMPNAPPPNVDYLYYVQGGFDIRGHVAAGDSLQFSYSGTYYGQDATVLSYSNTFGPGDFNASGANRIFLGDYYQLGQGATDISISLSIFIIRGNEPGQEPTYIDMDPTVSVFASVPEPASVWLVCSGIVTLWGFSKSRPARRIKSPADVG
jgi:hypothetical protein